MKKWISGAVAVYLIGLSVTYWYRLWCDYEAGKVTELPEWAKWYIGVLIGATAIGLPQRTFLRRFRAEGPIDEADASHSDAEEDGSD